MEFLVLFGIVIIVIVFAIANSANAKSKAQLSGNEGIESADEVEIVPDIESQEMDIVQYTFFEDPDNF